MKMLQNPTSRYICRSCSFRLSNQSRRHASSRSDKRDWLPSKPARTRFAPSPTGYLHLGSLRTALFNYLLAKRTGGQFLLRIEDTDQKRTVPGAEERLIKDLRWAGLEWDEGPEVGGPYGPYRQSERTSHYQKHADVLIQSEHAYRCFCSAERLKAVAETNAKIGLHTQYDRSCYHIPKEESADRASQGERHIVRLKDPERQPHFKDIVQGNIRDGKATTRQATDSYDDPVLLKTDGLPTYHLANVVDDHLMDITHVIRGAEWIISTRKHLIMYDAFGWTPPAFGHVGLLLDKSGSKLSKRAKSFDLSGMQEDGVLPEALNNFLVLLGWDKKGHKGDFLTMDQLKEQFDLKLTKGNPTVALEKLWFLSPKHAALRVQTGGVQFEEMVNHLVFAVHKYSKGKEGLELPIVKDGGAQLLAYLSQAVRADSKNYTTAYEFIETHPYYFLKDPPFPVRLQHPISRIKENRVLQGELWSDEEIRVKLLEKISPLTDSWDHDSLNKAIAEAVEYFQSDLGRVSHGAEEQAKLVMKNWIWTALRAYIAWGFHGPSLIESMILLGPQIALDRIANVEVAWTYDDAEGEVPEKSPESLASAAAPLSK